MTSTAFETGFLSLLSARGQEKLRNMSRSLRFAEGEAIFQEGDSSVYLWVVKRGRVALETDVKPRGRCVIQVAGPGELFSWTTLVHPRVEIASARAIEETEAVLINGQALEAACQKDTELGLELYRAVTMTLSDRLHAMRMLLQDLGVAA